MKDDNRVGVINPISDGKKVSERSINLMFWQDILYEHGYSDTYHYIRGLTGCRDYNSRENPKDYMDLLGECWNVYSGMYLDEKERWERRFKIPTISELSKGFGIFLRNRMNKFGEHLIGNVSDPEFDNWDQMRTEADQENRKRTIIKRRVAFREECARLGLEKKFFT